MRLLWSWLVLVLALVGVGSRPALADASATVDPSCFRGLSADGSTGLFDQPSANPGCSWRLRTGSFLGGFVENGYLLVGDRFRSMGGGVAVAATLGQHIELALQLGAQLGRIESSSTSPELAPEPSLLAISQFKLQLKLHSAWGRLVHVALMPTVRLPGAGQDFAPVPLNLDAAIDALLELNLRRALPQLPLTLSAQLGYVHDRSLRALDAQDCMGGTVADCLRARLQSTAAYSVGLPRLRLSIGAQLPLHVWRSLWLVPAVSYRIEAIVGDPDPVLLALLGMQSTAAVQNGRFQQWLTVGGRIWLGLPLSLDFGVRIGLQSAGYAMGAKVPQVMGYGALTWEIDLLAGQSQAADGRGTPAVPSVPPVMKTGAETRLCRVSGAIRDVQTGQPLADAVVHFVGQRHNALLTDDKGSFVSGELSCGAVLVEASRGDHQTMRLPVVLSAGEQAAVDIRLPKLLRAQAGRLWLLSQGDDGSKLPARATRSRDGQVVSLLSEECGLFARVAAGAWLLRVDAAGYLSREQTVVIPDGGEQRLQLLLSRRGREPKVQLGGAEIVLLSPLLFGPGGASLSRDSERVLDEVVDLLIHHPELVQLRIEQAADLQAGDGNLLEQQVIAVRDYLVSQGVAPDRVVARVTEGPRRTPPRISFKISAERHPSP